MLYELFVFFASICVLLKIFAVLTKGVAKSHTCLVGKTVLITGGNRGLGFETALALAARGCRLIIASKSDATEAKQKIIAATNNENIVTKRFDLASFDSIRKFAEDINKSESRLDILINNAGIGATDRAYTEDNNVFIMQINHLGPFLLTHLLLDLLKKTADAKIIFVSSHLAFFNNLTIDNINKRQNTKLFAYSNTKLCNIVATRVLAKKLQNVVKVNCLNPGLVKTSIYDFKESSLINRALQVLGRTLIVQIYGKTPEEGAQTAIQVALFKNCQNGAYYSDCVKSCLPGKAKDVEFCRKIFEISEELVGLSPFEKL